MEQRRHDKDEQQTTDGRDGRRQVQCEEGAVEDEEEHAGDHDEADGEVEDARLLRHDDAAVTAELVTPWEDLPLPLHACHFHLLDVQQCRGRGGAGWREGWGEVLTWAAEVTSRSRLSSEDELALDCTHLLSSRRSLDWVGDWEGDSRATRWYSPASSIKKAGKGSFLCLVVTS